MEENKGTKKMGWWKRVGRMDYSARMTVMVSAGMAVQVSSSSTTLLCSVL